MHYQYFNVNAEMGKEHKEMRSRKSRRKVSCVNCDKTMSWEYFRKHHIPTVHNGKKVPVKIIAKANVEGSSQNVHIRNLFLLSLTAISIKFEIVLIELQTSNS